MPELESINTANENLQSINEANAELESIDTANEGLKKKVQPIGIFGGMERFKELASALPSTSKTEQPTVGTTTEKGAAGVADFVQ